MFLLLLGGLAMAGGYAPRVEAQVPDERFQTHLDELDALSAWIEEVGARLALAAGQDRQAFVHQLLESWGEHHDAVTELADEIDRVGVDQVSSRITGAARAALAREITELERSVEIVADSGIVMRRELPNIPMNDRFAAELALSEVYSILRRALTWLVEDYEIVEEMGLSIPTNGAAVDQAFRQRAGLVSADLEFAVSRRSALRRRRDLPGVDTAAMALELAVLDERIESSTANMETLVDLMERRGLPTADYKRLLLTTTGEVGLAIFDREVVGGLLAEWWASIRRWAISNAGTFGVQGLIILAVLMVTRLVARMARRVAGRVLESDRLKVSGLLAQLVETGVSKAVWLIGFLVIMSVFGINVGPALAGLGIVGFVLGFALQDTLGNFAAGLMIMVYRPFDVGDLVTAGGVFGKVKDLTLVSTMITTLDNQLTVIPNGKVWGGVINNATAQSTRRVDLEFSVGHHSDITQVKRILEEIVSENELVLEDPAPVIGVHSLGDRSIDLVCRPWCKTEDLMTVRWGVTEAVKRRFDEEGVTMPFPVSDVRIRQTEEADAG